MPLAIGVLCDQPVGMEVVSDADAISVVVPSGGEELGNTFKKGRIN